MGRKREGAGGKMKVGKFGSADLPIVSSSSVLDTREHRSEAAILESQRNLEACESNHGLTKWFSRRHLILLR